MSYIVLSLSWVIWCFMHSLFISRPVTHFIDNRLSGITRYYRLFYNLFSIISLLPIIIYGRTIDSAVLFNWLGKWQWLRIFLLIVVLLIAFLGAREYNLWQFLGIRQIQKGTTRGNLTDGDYIGTHGILGYIRHPWYTAALIVVWLQPIDYKTFVVNGILCAYLVIGTILEEKKLIQQYGKQYIEYRKKAGMFFPYPKSFLPR